MLDSVRGGLKGDLARDLFGKMMGGGLLMYAAVTTRLGQEMRLDPSKSDFLTVTIGGQQIGPGSRFVSMARFVGNFLAQSYKDPSRAISLHQGDNFMQRYVRGQLSPLSGAMWNTVQGRNFIGEPTNGVNFFTQQLPDMMLPFWLSGFMNNPRPGWSGAPAEFFGARSFPLSLRKRADELANIEAHKIGNIDFKDLNKLEQEKIIRNNPEIQRLRNESNQLWADRGNEVNQYMAKVENYNTNIYYSELSKLIIRFERDLDGREFRNGLSDLNFAKRQYMNDVLRPEFPDVIKTFQEGADQRLKDPNAHIEDIAYDEYVRTVIGGDFENELGEFDYERRDEAEERIRNIYGPVVFQYIQDRLSVDTPPLVQALYEGRKGEIYQRYQNVGELLLTELGQESLIPTWKKYRTAFPEERDELADEYPILKQVDSASSAARRKVVEQDKTFEDFMLIWGYKSVAQHPTNQELGVEEVIRRYLHGEP